MTRTLGISGSLRAGSFNTALLHAAQQVAGDDITAAANHNLIDIATKPDVTVTVGDWN